MTTSLKRAGTVLLSVLLLCTLALSAGAASKLRVGVKFWKTGSDKESMANSGIDTSREASLTRQSNGPGWAAAPDAPWQCRGPVLPTGSQ